MGVIAKDPKLTTLYYHPENKNVNAYLAVMESLRSETNTIDLSQTKLTGTQWAELASYLNKKPDELIYKEHPYFIEKFNKATAELEDHDALRILQTHPEILLNPIALRNKKAVVAEHPNDITRLQNSDSGDVPIP
jgi:arsenate reductase-like glutaredoxin family protein